MNIYASLRAEAYSGADFMPGHNFITFSYFVAHGEDSFYPFVGM